MSSSPSTNINAAHIAQLVKEHTAHLAYTVRPDYLEALEAAAQTETNPRGREVLEQLLANAAIAAADEYPLCQDTGYVWVCLEVHDEDVCVPSTVFSGVDAAVAAAAQTAGMRRSILNDALLDRTNTTTNAPALCEVVFKPRAFGKAAPLEAQTPAASLPSTKPPVATLHLMLKGGGSDNASALTMLPPSAGVKGVMDFVVQRVSEKGANACPPLVIGVGVGASFDKVAGLAKHALLRPLSSQALQGEPTARASANFEPTTANIEALEAQLLNRINALGIGPGGLGGSTTALAVHIETAPCHIAALPVAVNIGCSALRSVSVPLY